MPRRDWRRPWPELAPERIFEGRRFSNDPQDEPDLSEADYERERTRVDALLDRDRV